ncbi:uncharacterized protein LOC110828487 isoform X2 [Zootermopsis nevadensis]|uniref:uncharacterized protein LOC110828487 isoform X2 n=1 Tax=Zootermopsis nevadensis TaxID=136037 RepID=UPI000B8E214B|nr:uncharacterized protein LOC110828487 isoform X2 [Zootermopsis nevadensis]
MCVSVNYARYINSGCEYCNGEGLVGVIGVNFEPKYPGCTCQMSLNGGSAIHAIRYLREGMDLWPQRTFQTYIHPSHFPTSVCFVPSTRSSPTLRASRDWKKPSPNLRTREPSFSILAAMVHRRGRVKGCLCRWMDKLEGAQELDYRAYPLHVRSLT